MHSQFTCAVLSLRQIVGLCASALTPALYRYVPWYTGLSCTSAPLHFNHSQLYLTITYTSSAKIWQSGRVS